MAPLLLSASILYTVGSLLTPFIAVNFLVPLNNENCTDVATTAIANFSNAFSQNNNTISALTFNLNDCNTPSSDDVDTVCWAYVVVGLLGVCPGCILMVASLPGLSMTIVPPANVYTISSTFVPQENGIIQSSEEQNRIAKNNQENSVAIKNCQENSTVVRNGQENSSVVRNGQENSTVIRNGQENSAVVRNCQENSAIVRNGQENSATKNKHNSSVEVQSSQQSSKCVRCVFLLLVTSLTVFFMFSMCILNEFLQSFAVVGLGWSVTSGAYLNALYIGSRFASRVTSLPFSTFLQPHVLIIFNQLLWLTALLIMYISAIGLLSDIFFCIGVGLAGAGSSIILSSSYVWTSRVIGLDSVNSAVLTFGVFVGSMFGSMLEGFLYTAYGHMTVIYTASTGILLQCLLVVVLLLFTHWLRSRCSYTKEIVLVTSLRLLT